MSRDERQRLRLAGILNDADGGQHRIAAHHRHKTFARTIGSGHHVVEDYALGEEFANILRNVLTTKKFDSMSRKTFEQNYHHIRAIGLQHVRILPLMLHQFVELALSHLIVHKMIDDIGVFGAFERIDEVPRGIEGGMIGKSGVAEEGVATVERRKVEAAANGNDTRSTNDECEKYSEDLATARFGRCRGRIDSTFGETP